MLELSYYHHMTIARILMLHGSKTNILLCLAALKRAKEKGIWTLISPSETPDLHHLYGKRVEERYIYYEQEAEKGNLQLTHKISAASLWRKLLTRLFETGYPSKIVVIFVLLKTIAGYAHILIGANPNQIAIWVDPISNWSEQ